MTIGIGEAALKISEKLRYLPRHWDGKEAILEMKDKNYRHWKQMEWIGFYFQFLCERYLSEVMEIPGPKFGNVTFDGLLSLPWDFKAHAMGERKHKIIVNDSVAIASAISQYGAFGLIIALGEAHYNDKARSFQKWHEELKGGASDYTKERIDRGAWSRIRKISFDVKKIALVKIDDETLERCGTFQVGFRNSNGSPRRPKVLLDVEDVDEYKIIEF